MRNETLEDKKMKIPMKIPAKVAKFVIVENATGKPVGFLMEDWATNLADVAGLVAPLGALARAAGVVAWCLQPGVDEVKTVCRIEK
jgi:hypothetical protein